MSLTNFNILPNQKIYIRFPEEYDIILGIDNLIISSNTLTGALKFTMIPRHLFISGF